ncbi:MAG: glycosyltransferase family 2 protein [Nanoarchaeota archaeon]|nr:glycosyltransferase family 2 protein [Nanoarchaeota archaeon]
MDLSIVIPAMNEEGNVFPLYERIVGIVKQLKYSFEIIFVDDGSRDQTVRLVEKLHGRDKHVKLLQFSRNFGKASALSAGLSAAQGKYVITMDADLQDDPAEIPRMLEKLEQGFDLVVGWKFKRKDPFITKRLPSLLFNGLIRWLHKVNIHDSDCNFRCMRKEVAKDLLFYGGLFRYIPSLAHWRGYRVTEIPVVHHKRFSGTAKFKGIGRLFKGSFDLLTVTFLMNYKNSPLYFFGSSGLLLFFLGFLGGVDLLYEKYVLGKLIAGRPLLLLTLLLIILGVQFVFFGLLGEMLTHMAQQQQPNYRIKKRL